MAANVFLDGLAGYRRVRGLAAVSMAWGWWGGEQGMAADLGEREAARFARVGMGALAPPQALELFDLALQGVESHVLPVALDAPALRARDGRESCRRCSTSWSAYARARRREAPWT